MRGDRDAPAPEPQGLTRSQTQTPVGPMVSKPMHTSAAGKVMKLKLNSNVREVSEKRQVGDTEEMLTDTASQDGWWKNVGMEEAM